MICKISFVVYAVLMSFLFVGAGTAGKLSHQYCDSESFILQATGAIGRLLPDTGNYEIRPCHDITIQNPQNALVNIKSVLLQLSRQTGGALLRFSPMNCTLYASLTPGGVSNARLRKSHVMLTASCVHTRILWPISNVEKDVIGESLMPPLVAMTFRSARPRFVGSHLY